MKYVQIFPQAAVEQKEGGSPKLIFRKPKLKFWTPREYQVVVMTMALYGRDMNALECALETRNCQQILSYLERNERRLTKDVKKIRIRNEEDEKALLAAIKRLQTEGDDKAKDENYENWESSGINNRGRLNTGYWTEKEKARLLKGIEIHGEKDIMALASVIKTRTTREIRKKMYTMLCTRDVLEQN